MSKLQSVVGDLRGSRKSNGSHGSGGSRGRDRAGRRAILALLAGACLWAAALPAWGVGQFIQVSTRMDALFDGARGLVYITTSDGWLLRYSADASQFLPPLRLSSSGLVGIAMSPDGSTLAVADSAYSGDVWALPPDGENGIHIVDLDAWTARRIAFARERGETGTHMVEFVDDTTVLTTSQFSGSGWVPMRRVDLTTDTAVAIKSVRQNTMLSAAADGSLVLYSESNSSAGPFGVYDPALETFRESGNGWYLFEAAANRDGTQLAIPTYFGMFVYDQDLAEIGVIGTYAGASPIGAAYHPTEDIVYLTWGGTGEAVQAWDTNSLTRLGVIDDGISFSSTGNRAFRFGRTRISIDGSGLTVTVNDGVKLYEGISFIDEDPDGDGVANRDDNCADVANPDQLDTDGNGIGDACNDSLDRDADDWEDGFDVCPDIADPDQADTDGNGVGDACNDDQDRDGDDWADSGDNCPDLANDQADPDGDGLGSACDPFPDRVDHALAQCEVDHDDALATIAVLEAELAVCRDEPDADADGVSDADDACPATAATEPVDADGCSHAQFCSAIEIGGVWPLVECLTSAWDGGGLPLRCRVEWPALVCGAR